MGMMNDGLSIADAMALAKDNDGAFGGAGGTWIWVFFLFFLLAWGGNGFFGNRGVDSAAVQGALTRADLFEGFNNNDVQRQLQGLSNGLCDGFYAQNSTMLNGFNTVGRELCQGFGGVNSNMSLGFAGVQSAINDAKFANQECCCTTNRSIDAVRYENAKNTCDIVNAIREDGQETRALINANTMQDLRDKIADKDRDLMTANFQLSQQAQSANIIGQLRPYPQPAYITCSPYEATMVAGQCYRGGCCN